MILVEFRHLGGCERYFSNCNEEARQCRENSRLAFEPLSTKLVEKNHEKKRGKCWVCLLKSETVATMKVFSHRHKEKKKQLATEE